MGAIFTFQIALIGQFRVLAPDGTQLDITNAKGAALIAYLALCQDYTAERSKIYNLLWSSKIPGATDKQLQDNLRHCTSALRKIFGAAEYERLFGQSNRRFLRLNKDAVQVDLLTLESSLKEDEVPDFSGLLENKTIDLLSHLEIPNEQEWSDWLQDQRTHWSERLTTALLEFQDIGLPTINHNERSERASIALRLAPENEKAHRELMMAYAIQGNVLSARRQFDSLVTLLENEYDWEPSDETIRLIDDINAGHVGVAKLPKPSDLQSIPSERTRLVVVPFAVSPPTEDDGVLRVGICDRIIEALSKINDIAVLAHSSVFRLSAEEIAPAEMAQILNADYLLRGSIRHVSESILVSTQLVRCKDSEVVFSMSFRQAESQSFELEGQIARELAGDLEMRVLQIEIDRVMRGSGEDTSQARDWVLRAIPLIYDLSQEKFGMARQHLDHALVLDDTYAPAHTWMAFWCAFFVGQGWGNPSDLAKANFHARRAIELEPNDPRAHAIAGHVTSFLLGQPELGEFLLDKSLLLNPNSGFAWAFSAINQCYLGRPDAALERMKEYSSLCPYDPFGYFFDTIYCIAHTLMGNYTEGASWGQRTTGGNPKFINGLKPYLVCLGHLGRTKEAAHFRKAVLGEQPEFSISRVRESYPLRDANQLEAYCKGLKLAGFPE